MNLKSRIFYIFSVLILSHYSYAAELNEEAALREADEYINSLSPEEFEKGFREDGILRFTIRTILCLSGAKNFDFYTYAIGNCTADSLNDEGWVSVPVDALKALQQIEEFPRQQTIKRTYVKLLRERLLQKKGLNVSLPSADDPYSISCGPISLASAHEILFQKGLDWREKVLQFPTFKLGVFPHNLVKHFNQLSNETGLSIRHQTFRNFVDFIELMRDELEAGKPVTVLLVFSATAQHYANVVAINPEKQAVILLDPSGVLVEVSYDWLESIASATVNCNSGSLYAACSLITVPLMKLLTSYGPYNAFTYTVNKEKID